MSTLAIHLRMRLIPLFLLITITSFSTASKAQTDGMFFIELVDGGVPKDGIPAIDTPKFVTAAVYDNTDGHDEALILGAFINGEAKAYPFDILVWHEIVNDYFGGENFSITYCPLTGSGVGFDTKKINGSSLGTTGKLYENNLVFYDRLSDTYWIQMMNFAIWGSNRRDRLDMIPVVQTTWRAWKALHPDTLVLSRETSHKRNYDLDPYNDPPVYYNSSDSIWFPTVFDWTKEPFSLYHEKTWTLVIRSPNGLYDNLYPYPELAKRPVLNDVIGKEHFVIAYNYENSLVIPFSSSLENGTTLHFSTAEKTNLDSSITLGLTVFRDEESGSIWNMRGEAILGSLVGTKLRQLPAYTAYWFAASAFFVPGGAKIFAVDSTSSSGDSSGLFFFLVSSSLISGFLAAISCLVFFYRKYRKN